MSDWWDEPTPWIVVQLNDPAFPLVVARFRWGSDATAYAEWRAATESAHGSARYGIGTREDLQPWGDELPAAPEWLPTIVSGTAGALRRGWP